MPQKKFKKEEKEEEMREDVSTCLEYFFGYFRMFCIL
jgi:hypothetical protein